MKQKSKKRKFLAMLTSLLCVPLTLGIATGCCDDGGAIEQSKTADSAAVSFTSMDQVTNTDPYAVNALNKEVNYLLKLDPDKLLYYFYINAGIKARAPSSYGGGWEGTLIGGHTLGHYISALAQLYVNAGVSAADKADVLDRLEYIVECLKECQDMAGTTSASKAGFLWGASLTAGGGTRNVEYGFDYVEQTGNGFSANTWVPWYTMHKILQGLIDVAVYTGNPTAKTCAVALGDWVYNRVMGWTAQVQARVLTVEYGGMNDCLYNLYQLTGEDKYAVAAHKFDEETLFTNIRNAKKNYLNELHANTTIPKVLGALNRYVTCDGKTIDGETVDAEYYLAVAEDFWQYVIDHHTYVTGGNSEWERFGRDDVLDQERTNANCETCNTYNMLKLSRMLFTITGEKKYLDYYENTYYNAIWSSQNPETGMTTYFQPMATGYFKVYSSEDEHFWCCTGSGMESMSKLNDSIYYQAGNAVYVSLYLSSVYRSDSVSLTQTADLENSDTVTIKVDSGSTVLRLRRPYWSDSFAVTVNNNDVIIEGNEDFVSVDVSKGDTVTVQMRKSVKAYNLPDGEDVYAFIYGPFVLSAELGTEAMTSTVLSGSANVDVPAKAIGNQTYIVSASNLGTYMENIDQTLTRGSDGKFTLTCENGSLTYSYHFRQYTQRYGIYIKFAAGEVEEEEAAWVWENTDTRQAGYGQYETDLQESGNGSESETSAGLGSTRCALENGSFTYTALKVTAGARNRLAVSFAKEDNGKTILVKSGGTTLYSGTLNYSGEQDVYQVYIDIPDSVVSSAVNGTIPVTFSGVNDAKSARLCSFFYTQTYTFNDKAQDGKVAYFVDCGDYDTYTLSSGDKLGVNQSVTEQIYGTDAVTGKKWGLVDNNASTGMGACPEGIYTNSTWAQENLAGDGMDKTVSNRYTKNHWETGMARNLHYKFELENGTYTVKLYFSDPWGCSQNPSVSANGTEKLTRCGVYEEVEFTVTVTDGELTLDITAPPVSGTDFDTMKCINLCYIQILFNN